MAHENLPPDGKIAPNMHGFDPASNQKVLGLLANFSDRLSVAPFSIDVSDNSFYLNASMLAELVQGERKQTYSYDGFACYFGLDSRNRIVLLLNRIKLIEKEHGIADFDYVPQVLTVAGEDEGRQVVIETFEAAVKISNEHGQTTLTYLDIFGSDYVDLRSRFQLRFANLNDNIKIVNNSPSLNDAFGRPTPDNFEKRILKTGFFIGWGILNHITEGGYFDRSVRLQLGLGNLSLNPKSPKTLHIIANGTKLIPTEEIKYWSTQDSSLPVLILNGGRNTVHTMAAIIPDNSTDPNLPASDSPTMAPGTSCSYSTEQKVPQGNGG